MSSWVYLTVLGIPRVGVLQHRGYQGAEKGGLPQVRFAHLEWTHATTIGSREYPMSFVEECLPLGSS
jgi:hypothetical protein